MWEFQKQDRPGITGKSHNKETTFISHIITQSLSSNKRNLLKHLKTFNIVQCIHVGENFSFVL